MLVFIQRASSPRTQSFLIRKALFIRIPTAQHTIKQQSSTTKKTNSLLSLVHTQIQHALAMKKIIKHLPINSSTHNRLSISQSAFTSALSSLLHHVGSPSCINQHHNTATLRHFSTTSSNKLAYYRSAQLDRLESHAEEDPNNADAQALYMHKLNETGQFDEVIRRYDSQQYARNRQVDFEYAQVCI